jgi:hypothetical protein
MQLGKNAGSTISEAGVLVLIGDVSFALFQRTTTLENLHAATKVHVHVIKVAGCGGSTAAISQHFSHVIAIVERAPVLFIGQGIG